MCGIGGLWLRRAAARNELTDLARAMAACLVHRGPDGEGLWISPQRPLAFAHRRLAVIDLSDRAAQPMHTPDGSKTIVFNGEIYNFRSVRAELERDGLQFRSDSDTEVVLLGYERWGIAILDRLVGMFAFAIWDETRQSMFLARDRLGEKPLYYAPSSDGLAFASEINALTQLPWLDRTIDPLALSLYLKYQYVPSPIAIYKSVRKLPPGHAMLVTQNATRVWRYWDPVVGAAGPPLTLNPAEAAERLHDLLIESVRGQMIADVPLGAFLSGGVDSSTVVSLMTRLAPGRVRTFTIGFRVPGFDEAEFARQIAEHLGTSHTVEYLTELDALRIVPQIPGMYGEPFADPSAIPTHLLARITREHVTVALSGDGGDECFGGYPRYDRLEQLERLAAPLGPVRQLAAVALEALPGRARRLAAALREDTCGRYRSLVSLFPDQMVERLTGVTPHYAEFDAAWRANTDAAPRRRAMLTDLFTYLPEAILVKVDRAAMATSLETRAPFLDHRVLEFALRLPDDLVRRKTVLKLVGGRYVPRKLLDRPKRGFAVPLSRWFRGELRELLSDSLTPRNLLRAGVESRGVVEQMVADHLSTKHDHGAALWALLTLALWAEDATPSARSAERRAHSSV